MYYSAITISDYLYIKYLKLKIFNKYINRDDDDVMNSHEISIEAGNGIKHGDGIHISLSLQSIVTSNECNTHKTHFGKPQ